MTSLQLPHYEDFYMIYASIPEDLLIPLFPIPDPINVFAFLVHPKKGEKHFSILMDLRSRWQSEFIRHGAYMKKDLK